MTKILDLYTSYLAALLGLYKFVPKPSQAKNKHRSHTQYF